ncbi:MAG: hypothetical protein QOJ35_891 [Solirubrobacteraceae bacterium]|nr:hypothetical protein [Solirubrobacteraceae bacterium]
MPARSPILLALALATLSAPAAHAAWTPPQALTGAGAVNVSGAGNRHGSEAFVWKVESRRLVHLPAQTGFAGSIRARIRLPDGRLGRPQTISSSGEIVASPQVGVDEHGDVTAVWVQAGRHIRVMAAFHPHGKPFGRPVELGRSGHFADAQPQLAVGRFGDAVVAWNSGFAIKVARGAGNAQCAPARHFACFEARSLSAGADQVVAIGPLGSAYVAWAANERGGDTFHTRLRLIVVRRSGRSGGEVAISRAADGDASQPSIAVHPDGIAELAWRASIPAGGEQNAAAPIWAATSDPASVVAEPQPVTVLAAERPVVRVDGLGEAIIAFDQRNFTRQNPDGQEVAYAVRAPGAAAVGPPATITPANVAAGGATLAVDAAGSAYLAYSAALAIDPPPGGPFGVSHVRPAGGAFGPAVALPASFSGVRLLAAGPKVTAISAGGSTLLSDWTP